MKRGKKGNMGKKKGNMGRRSKEGGWSGVFTTPEKSGLHPPLPLTAHLLVSYGGLELLGDLQGAGGEESLGFTVITGDLRRRLALPCGGELTWERESSQRPPKEGNKEIWVPK